MLSFMEKRSAIFWCHFLKVTMSIKVWFCLMRHTYLLIYNMFCILNLHIYFRIIYADYYKFSNIFICLQHGDYMSSMNYWSKNICHINYSTYHKFINLLVNINNTSNRENKIYHDIILLCFVCLFVLLYLYCLVWYFTLLPY